MTNKEIIEVLDDMKVKIRIPEAAVTQLKRNEALEEAIKRFKQPHIEIVDYATAAQKLSEVTVSSGYEWLWILQKLKIVNLYICEEKQGNEHRKSYFDF